MDLEHGCDNRHWSEGGIQISDDLTYICYTIKTNKEKGKFQLKEHWNLTTELRLPNGVRRNEITK